MSPRSDLEFITRESAGALEFTNIGNAWPAEGFAEGTFGRFKVLVYSRGIGRTGRARPMERRFQNPADLPSRKMEPPPDTLPVLLGIWTEQGATRTVVVAMDAARRIGQTRRVSLFMPLALLEEAADTGFAEHHSSSGEQILAFRPGEIRRYFDRLVDELERADYSSLLHHDRVAESAQERPSLTISSESYESVGIRPRVGMYSAFARLNYSPWFALAEFVDNSIQSYIDSAQRPSPYDSRTVDVRLDEDEIVITDRAAGIPWSEFPRAFSPSQPPPEPTGLSEFGLGMKAAACWFAKRWKVRTSALGEPVARTIQFDVPRISRDGIENLPVQSEPAAENDHFTVVTLQDLRVRPQGRTIGKIKDHLASIYRVLIRDHTLQIRFTTPSSSELLEHTTPDLLVAPYFRESQVEPKRWKQEFDITLPDNRRVSGWAGLLAKGSVSRAGFAVFRRGRLIQGSADETYRPPSLFRSPNSYTYQRLVGELFVEGFDVTHTKDGIQWAGLEDRLMENIKRELNSSANPLLQQAEGFRSRVSASIVEPGFGKTAISSTGQLISTDLSREVLRSQINDVPDLHRGESKPTGPSVTADRSILTRRSFLVQIPSQSAPWRVTLELIRDPAEEWYSCRVEPQKEESELVVQINLAHPFSEQFINETEEFLTPIFRIVAALALSEQTARLSGVPLAGEIRRRMNELLRESLSGSSEAD